MHSVHYDQTAVQPQSHQEPAFLAVSVNDAITDAQEEPHLWELNSLVLELVIYAR